MEPQGPVRPGKNEPLHTTKSGERSGSSQFYQRRQWIGLIGAPLAFMLLLFLPAPSELSAAGWRTLALMVLMAFLWLTEAIPISATALMPLVLLPVLDVSGVAEAARPYAHPLIFLFMGGFMIAQAMQRWNLHRRIAFNIVRVMGTSPQGIVGGFMVATALLSMWVSNTATALMMLPVGVSVIALLQSAISFKDSDQVREVQMFGTVLMLGIGYASSIGGLGTLIGTPPNAFMAAFLDQTYGLKIGFAQWMLVGVPLVLTGLPLTWWLLTRVVFPLRLKAAGDARALLSSELTKLGRISYPEKVVGLVFLLVAVLWILRPFLSGWLARPAALSDSDFDTVIAMAGALALFLIPVNLKEGAFVLSWREAQQLPWGILILFGGGLSLAKAIEKTELAQWMGSLTSAFSGFPVLVLVLAIVVMILFLTEFTSNTATAAAFLPVAGSVAVGMDLSPALLVVPAALAASCAFMMPVATPPNAIVFSSGYVTLPQMVRAGLWTNALFALLIPILVWTLGSRLLPP